MLGYPGSGGYQHSTRARGGEVVNDSDGGLWEAAYSVSKYCYWIGLQDDLPSSTVNTA